MSAIGDWTPRSSQSGFTLIEALVVVGIVALLASIVAPRIQGIISGQEFRTARSSLILGVRETRALAIRSGGPARFAIEQNGRSFQVHQRAAQKLPQSVALSSEGKTNSVVFYPDGTSNGALFSLRSKDRREQFVIFPTTGIIAEVQQ